MCEFRIIFLLVLCPIASAAITAVDAVELPTDNKSMTQQTTTQPVPSATDPVSNNQTYSTEITTTGSLPKGSTASDAYDETPTEKSDVASTSSEPLQATSPSPPLDSSSEFVNDSKSFNDTFLYDDSDLLQPNVTASNDSISTNATEGTGDDHPGNEEEDLAVRQTMLLDDYCSCDLKRRSCDVGCCCDQDCSSQDLRAFATCYSTPRSLTGDSRYCYQRWVVGSHNTEYTVHRTRDGLFCIHTDNLLARTSYTPIKPARSMEQYEKLLRRAQRRVPPAPTHQPEGATPGPRQQYTQGAPVWAADQRGAIFQLGVPSSLLGGECDTVSKLSYLQDSHTSCRRVIRGLLDSACPAALHPYHYVSFLVVAQPNLLLKQPPATEPPEDNNTTSVPETEDRSTDATTEDEVTTSAKSTAITSTTINSLTTTTKPSVPTVNSQNLSRGDSHASDPDASSMDDARVLPKGVSSLESSLHFSWLNNSDNIYNSTHLIKVQIIICNTYDNEETCQDAEDFTSKEEHDCLDVVKRVEYVIIHNGTTGIQSVIARLHLVPLKSIMDTSTDSHRNTFSESNFEQEFFGSLEQSFSVVYRWDRESSEQDAEVEERSGRPGYIRGKPLLLGIFVKNTTQEGRVLEAISTDDDPTQGLTVLAAGGADGGCGQRKLVTFGENIRSVCAMQVLEQDIKTDCDTLRTKILNELLGPALADTSKELRIASYGDSSVMRPDDWIPLLRTKQFLSESYDADFQLSEEGRCPDLILSIRIEVAFALQGSLANPQARVIGSLLTTGPPQLSPPTGCVGVLCSPGFATLMSDPLYAEWEGFPHNLPTVPHGHENRTIAIGLSTSVVFIDMSKAAKPLFPDPPRLDLNLPYDFFYPYLPSRAANNCDLSCHVLTLVLIVAHLNYFEKY